MTLRRLALPKKPTARTGAVLAVLALLGGGIAATNTDRVVAGRFTAALEAAPSRAAVDVAETVRNTLISGSEAFWLEKRRHEAAGAAIEPAAWSAAAPFMENVAIGTRITISNGKDDHVLEVVAITDVVPEPEGAGTSNDTPPERKIAITCRDLSAPDGRLLTFETSAGTAGRAVRSARAL